jgi:hypothetical protein
VQAQSSSLNHIFPLHRADLQKSGLSDATIQAMKIRSMTSAAICRAIYGSASDKSVPGDGYAIPYLDLNGNPIPDGTGGDLVRFRMFDPRPDSSLPDGYKKIRYMQPVGSQHNVYVPPGFWAIKSDVLLITEGEKKAAKAVQEGFPCIAISGVSMWFDPEKRKASGSGEKPKLDAETPLLPLIVKLAEGRKVIVIADSDAAENQHVRNGMKTLARAILVKIKGKDTYFEVLPNDQSVTKTKKIGLDDFLIAQDGVKKLTQLIDGSLKGSPVKPGFKLRVPYAKGPENDFLNYLLPYKVVGMPFHPTWLQQKTHMNDKGEVEVVHKEIKAIYAYYIRTLRIVDVEGGVAQVNNPDVPVRVVTEVIGTTDDRREVIVHVNGETLNDPKFWTSLGFLDASKIKSWLPILQTQIQNSPKHVYATSHKGWVAIPGDPARHYICGENVISPNNGTELIALPGNGTTAVSGVVRKGGWEVYQQIFTPLLHNPALAAMAGFAVSGPLLSLIPATEPGIINIYGHSGKGKSSLLRFVASLVGNSSEPADPGSYMQTWRTTENGMEAPLEARNDSFIGMDELHQAPARTDWQALAYSAANGRGKARMTKEIEARRSKSWRCQILSSGECSLESKILESNKNMPEGLRFRVIDLPATEWTDIAEQVQLPEFGRYAVLKPFMRAASSPTAEVIDAALSAVGQHHGLAWPKIIAYLQAGGDETARKDYEVATKEITRLAPPDARPTLLRRIKHMAIAMTGLNVLLNVLDVGAAEADEIRAKTGQWVVKVLWYAGLPSATGSEQDSIRDTVNSNLLSRRSQFYVHGAEAMENKNNAVDGSPGWIDNDGTAYIPKSSWNRICSGLGVDPRRAQEAVGAISGEKRHPVAAKSTDKKLSVLKLTCFFEVP